MDASQLPWLLAVLGFIVLGIAIGYGLSRNRQRTPAGQKPTAAGTQKLYREEEQRPGKD